MSGGPVGPAGRFKGQQWHALQAEHLLREAEVVAPQDPYHARTMVLAAQAHATLATIPAPDRLEQHQSDRWKPAGAEVKG